VCSLMAIRVLVMFAQGLCWCLVKGSGRFGQKSWSVLFDISFTPNRS